MNQLLLIEFNEVNFEAVRRYSAEGALPEFQRLIDNHGVSTTYSEDRFEEIEPWIQWVTAHTGLSFSEHRVFRLGDIVQRDIVQIWERLESDGFSVGAISPMNAENRTKDAAFFIPDPWTSTHVSGSGLLRKLYRAISQAVNDNAQARLLPSSAFWLTVGALANARAKNYRNYLQLARRFRCRPWTKAMFLDLFLSDTFIRHCRRAKPNFASLFVNAAAHIQHHYMFSSATYDGPMKNPDWYIGGGEDPVLEIYELYDHILGHIRKTFPNSRLMIATGLHQDPHTELTYYWRFKDHAAFLRRLGVPFNRVEPRMARDFLISCANRGDAADAERLLKSAVGQDGTPILDVDNRGTDLFVMLTYPKNIPRDFVFKLGDKSFGGLRDEVAFVAIKNGQHNGTGYFIDTGKKPGELAPEFPLKQIPSMVCHALGVEWDTDFKRAVA